MRFIVIADRFSMELKDIVTKKRALKQIEKSDRTVEELKDRYYTISREVLRLRGQEQHPIVKVPFSFEHEVKRKNNLEKIFMRTKEQQEREKMHITFLKNIETKIKKMEKEEHNLLKLKHADFNDTSIPPQLRKQSGVMLLSDRF